MLKRSQPSELCDLYTHEDGPVVIVVHPGVAKARY